MIAFQIYVTSLFVILCACARLEPPADIDCRSSGQLATPRWLGALKAPLAASSGRAAPLHPSSPKWSAAPSYREINFASSERRALAIGAINGLRLLSWWAVVPSAGTTSAATHSSLACSALLRQRADGRAACACLAQPDDSDLSESPRTVRFNHHGDAKYFPDIPTVHCQVPQNQGYLLLSICLQRAGSGLASNTLWNALRRLLWFCDADSVFMTACNHIVKCATVIFVFYFQFLRLFSINLFVCLW